MYAAKSFHLSNRSIWKRWRQFQPWRAKKKSFIVRAKLRLYPVYIGYMRVYTDKKYIVHTEITLKHPLVIEFQFYFGWFSKCDSSITKSAIFMMVIECSILSFSSKLLLSSNGKCPSPSCCHTGRVIKYVNLGVTSCSSNCWTNTERDGFPFVWNVLNE